MESFSLRVPEQWAGQLNSVHVQRWLADFFQAPRSLPDDPGPGRVQISLSLPARAVRVLSAGLGQTAAVALRRLSALHLGSLPPGGRELILPALTVSESSPWSAPSAEYGHSVEAPGYSRLEWYDNHPASTEASGVTVGPSRSDSSLATPREWWAELPFPVRVTLIVAGILFLLVFLLSKCTRRVSLPVSLPKPEFKPPEFKPWTPVGS